MAEKELKTDLHVLAAWLRNRGLEVELREHPTAKSMREHREKTQNSALSRQ